VSLGVGRYITHTNFMNKHCSLHGSLHNTYQLHEQTLLITLWYSRRFFRVLIDKKQGDESNMFGLKRRLETFSRIVKDSI
jgi:hypothetical protein